MLLRARNQTAQMLLRARNQTAQMLLRARNQTAQMLLRARNQTAQMLLRARNQTAQMLLRARNQTDQQVPPLPAAVLGRIARALQSGGDGPDGGAGGGLRDSIGTGRTSAGSTAFSRSAARAGGRAVAGISAYQRGDAGALADIGLSLADLEALEDNWDRAVAIADAATGGDPARRR